MSLLFLLLSLSTLKAFPNAAWNHDELYHHIPNEEIIITMASPKTSFLIPPRYCIYTESYKKKLFRDPVGYDYDGGTLFDYLI